MATMRVTRTVFDFERFERVLVGKDVGFEPLAEEATIEQILSAVGNDTKKLAKLVSVGMKDAVRDASYQSSAGWHTYKDEDANAMDELNGEFTNAIADESDVNETVRTLAKTVFGYSPADTDEDKKAKKQMARDMVKNTPQIREGLQKKAAAQSSGK